MVTAYRQAQRWTVSHDVDPWRDVAMRTLKMRDARARPMWRHLSEAMSSGGGLFAVMMMLIIILHELL